MKIKHFAVAAFLSSVLAAGSAQASALTIDRGWKSFNFGDAGPSFEDDFAFTITDTAYFMVTDAYCIGDRFEIAVNGISAGLTSKTAPDESHCAKIISDADEALATKLFSFKEIEFTAGSYLVSGTVIDSPYFGGAAYAQLSSTSLIAPLPAVPLPASSLLLLSGLAGVLGLRHKKKT